MFVSENKRRGLYALYRVPLPGIRLRTSGNDAAVLGNDVPVEFDTDKGLMVLLSCDRGFHQVNPWLVFYNLLWLFDFIVGAGIFEIRMAILSDVGDSFSAHWFDFGVI
jgi:hypothetical protein